MTRRIFGEVYFFTSLILYIYKIKLQTFANIGLHYPDGVVFTDRTSQKRVCGHWLSGFRTEPALMPISEIANLTEHFYIWADEFPKRSVRIQPRQKEGSANK